MEIPLSQEDETAPETRGIIRRLVGPAFALATVGLVLTLLHSLTRDIDYHAMIYAVRHTPSERMWAAIAATGISFLALVGRDAGALRYVGARVPPLAVLLASFCGSALGNAIGFGALAGGAVRYRTYGAVGVTPEQVARIMIFITFSFALGLAAFAAANTVVAARAVGQLLGVSAAVAQGGGIFILLAVAGLVGLCGRNWRPLRLGSLRGEVPGARLVLVQLGLTAVDLIAAAAALWFLLPSGKIDFATFSAVFAVATALGVISHIPGGLGVFEAVVVFALGHRVSPNLAAAALLAYRGVYFLLPLMIAAILLAAFELRRSLAGAGAAIGAGGRVLLSAGQLAPVFLSVITFTIGMMLLVSGSTPVSDGRLAQLHGVLPLWAIETSNFLASLTGAFLLFVARGLFHRLDGAWWLALIIALANLALAPAKGFALGNSLVVSCLILLLLATRQQFSRPASFLRQPFTIEWFVTVTIVFVASAWILFFAFRDVAYSHSLWWQFEFDAQAPRALRAIVGAAVLALGGALWQLLRPASGRIAPPGCGDLEHAERIIRGQTRSDAMLAMMGDKNFLFSASGNSLLSYAKNGRTWVTLYDPVGPREEWPELIWRFVEMADEHGGRVAFYEVRPDSLPLYLDAGLKVMKLGEEACIPLANFTTEGAAGAASRYILKRGEREGFDLEIVPPETLSPDEAAQRHDVLAVISEAWLADRKAREKGFSVAAFEPRFVARQWVALLRQAGTPVAFVTVMTTDEKSDATAGLMRHTSGASRYAMEYIFTRLAMHLKNEGFTVFSLGMAPLSGLTRAPLSSLWHRIAGLFWEHGGKVYGLQGLRVFKNKFHPTWEPRYLAASGSLGPFVALTDVAILAGGGRRT